MTHPNRVGIYAWAGPGTIRLLQTKYHSPTISRDSFLHGYDLSYLQRLKNLFGVTDAWVSYSWGFADETEQEDYRFLRHSLPAFQKLHIKAHAYVQGLNLVTKEFQTFDPWCRDPWGKPIPYSKGRQFTCPNNPSARQIVLDRVWRASREDVDGIYIDNILFGLPPVYVSATVIPFFGCSCRYCQQRFKNHYGYELPLREKTARQISDYLSFRSQSVDELIHECSRVARSAKKEFGINLYDPTLRLDSLYYGYSVPTIEKELDYFLIENHAFPRDGKSMNTSLTPLKNSYVDKELFVISYKSGIGDEANFSQADIDLVFSDAHSLGYFPCLKVTEFTTNGVWHMLDIKDLHSPVISALDISSPPWQATAAVSNPITIAMSHLLQKPISLLSTDLVESKFLASIIKKTGLYQQQVRKPRITHL